MRLNHRRIPVTGFFLIKRKMMNIFRSPRYLRIPLSKSLSMPCGFSSFLMKANWKLQHRFSPVPSEALMITSYLPQRLRIMSIQICILPLPLSRGKKTMNGLLRHGIQLLWRKDIMKSVFWSWQTTLKAGKYSGVTSLSHGAAGTVVIFMKDWKHLRNVLPVCDLPDILNF